MAGKANRRGFGYVRKLPSKRQQASYIGPDMARHAALKTFDTKGDAEAWLIAERTLIAADAWTPPKLRRELAEAKRPATFSAYATVWLKDRDLKPRTRSHYQALLDNQLKTWDALPINDIRPEMVRDWHANLNKKHATTRAHAYGLLRTILATAVSDGLLPANPCHIRGAGTAKRTAARVSAETAAAIGLTDGELVRVSTPDGAVTVRLAVTSMPDYVVWLPTNAPDCAVRRELTADAGDVVDLAPAGSPDHDDEVTA